MEPTRKSATRKSVAAATVVPWYTCTITHTTQHTQHSTHNMHRLGLRLVGGPRFVG
jgi:hypothetical protein